MSRPRSIQLALVVSTLASLAIALPCRGEGTPNAVEPVQATPEEAIEAALARTAELHLNGTLEELRATVAAQYQIPVQLDLQALEDDNTSPHALVTVEISGVSLESALATAVEPLGLCLAVHHEHVVLTTFEGAEAMLQTKVYSVEDLLQPLDDGLVVRPAQGLDDLLEVIKTATTGDGWEETGGVGTISQVPHLSSITITHTRQVHAQARKLLSMLRAARATQAAARRARLRVVPDSNELVLKVYYLSTPAEPESDPGRPDMEDPFREDENPLQQNSDKSSNADGSPFLPDVQRASGTTEPDGPDSGSDAEPARDNEGTPPAGDESSTPHLAVPIAVLSDAPGPSEARSGLVAQFLETIPRVIEPESWQAVGGQGTIHRLGRALVVRQTPRIQAQIKELISAVQLAPPSR